MLIPLDLVVLSDVLVLPVVPVVSLPAASRLDSLPLQCKFIPLDSWHVTRNVTFGLVTNRNRWRWSMSRWEAEYWYFYLIVTCWVISMWREVVHCGVSPLLAALTTTDFTAGLVGLFLKLLESPQFPSECFFQSFYTNYANIRCGT